MEMTHIQEEEFARLGLDFPGLFGRRLQPIDCQNLFCEISKYARVAHPEFPGINNRTQIKQNYHNSLQRIPAPMFPPRWNLDVPKFDRSEEHTSALQSLMRSSYAVFCLKTKK